MGLFDKFLTFCNKHIDYLLEGLEETPLPAVDPAPEYEFRKSGIQPPPPDDIAAMYRIVSGFNMTYHSSITNHRLHVIIFRENFRQTFRQLEQDLTPFAYHHIYAHDIVYGLIPQLWEAIKRGSDILETFEAVLPHIEARIVELEVLLLREWRRSSAGVSESTRRAFDPDYEFRKKYEGKNPWTGNSLPKIPHYDWEGETEQPVQHEDDSQKGPPSADESSCSEE
ncbi:hypothetical protein ABW19_dt0201604 [Dactylella cylindrospora]|nr:hypothetical protein ABW19_dt0201604 [Dactylella cylindrospora]